MNHSILIIFFISFYAHTKTSIIKELPSEKLIFLSNGRVLFKNSHHQTWSKNPSYKSFNQIAPPEFEPTLLESENKAQEIFNNLRTDYKRLSECSDRAHVWAFDEFQRSGVKSKKIFIFFTASYINRNKFKWWFHVAPMVHVKSEDGIKEMVLDFRYADKPLSIKEWSDMMVYSKRSCKVTTKFSEYDINPQTEDCYLIKESMFYRYPWQIYDQERKGQFRTEFNQSEVNFIKRNSFLSWNLNE